MSDLSTKTFDAVHMVRAVRDELSLKIAAMSVEEENRWLRSTELPDSKLRRLMELAGERNAAAGGVSPHDS
jgi:hypothetical protein